LIIPIENNLDSPSCIWILNSFINF
jgi:hypothetical protein